MGKKDSRYNLIFKIPSNLYIQSSPVFIERGGVFYDTLESHCLSVFKFVSLSHKTIKTVQILVQAWFAGDEEVHVYEYTYDDLNVNVGEAFGSDEAVGFPEASVRTINVSVYRVEFTDGERWTSKERNWKPISMPPSIEEYFHDSFLEGEYLRSHGKDALYIPVERDGIFKCTCGTINPSGNACSKCGREYKELKKDLNPGYLAKKSIDKICLKNQIESLTYENETETSINVQRTAGVFFKRKMAVSIAFVSVVLCVVVLLSTFVVLPQKEKQDAYDVAMEKLDAGFFEEARVDFLNLGGYKDSKQMANKAIYKSAEEMESAGNLEGAVDTWQKISEYADSQSRITRATERIGFQHEVEYLNGRVALNDGNYETAIALFSSLGSYKDADNYKKNSQYQYANQLLNNRQYFDAIVQFENILDYSDSALKIEEAREKYILDNYAPSYNESQNIPVNPWKVTVTAVDTNGQGLLINPYISIYDKWFVYFTLEGGPPGNSTEVTYTGYFPGGGTASGIFENEMYSGQTGICCFYFDNPENANTGTFTIQFKDSMGNIIGTHSISLVGK